MQPRLAFTGQVLPASRFHGFQRQSFSPFSSSGSQGFGGTVLRKYQAGVGQSRSGSVASAAPASAEELIKSVGTDMEERQEQEYLYFCYGSNLSREKVRSRGNDSTPPIGFTDVWVGRIANFMLCFNLRGSLPAEPAMGSMEEEPGDEIYGLVYRLDSKRSWDKLLKSEGVKSEQDKRTPYNVISVHVECHRPGKENEKRTVVAKTLITNPRFQMSRSLQRRVRPSRRYMQLLIDGAKFEKLPEEYITRLQNITVARRWQPSLLTWMMSVVVPLQFASGRLRIQFLMIPIYVIGFYLFAAHENFMTVAPKSWRNQVGVAGSKLGLFFLYGCYVLPALLLLLLSKRSRRGYRMMRRRREEYDAKDAARELAHKAASSS